MNTAFKFGGRKYNYDEDRINEDFAQSNYWVGRDISVVRPSKRGGSAKAGWDSDRANYHADFCRRL